MRKISNLLISGVIGLFLSVSMLACDENGEILADNNFEESSTLMGDEHAPSDSCMAEKLELSEEQKAQFEEFKERIRHERPEGDEAPEKVNQHKVILELLAADTFDTVATTDLFAEQVVRLKEKAAFISERANLLEESTGALVEHLSLISENLSSEQKARIIENIEQMKQKSDEKQRGKRRPKNERGERGDGAPFRQCSE